MSCDRDYGDEDTATLATEQSLAAWCDAFWDNVDRERRDWLALYRDFYHPSVVLPWEEAG